MSGTAYWIFYIAKKDQMQPRKIQISYPAKKIIHHEIKWSVISISIMSFLTAIVITSILNGHTKMYFTFGEYGWLYFIASPVFCIFINDSYFYWTHRFMHLKSVFPWVHKIHHLSKTPTPWSIFSFSPIETLILYTIFPILVFFIPLHPVSLGIIVFYNVFNNVIGHLGFEIIPLRFHRHWLLKYGLTITHHDLHHAKVKCNFGLYFNLWDRLMKTNHADNEKKFMQIQGRIHATGLAGNRKEEQSSVANMIAKAGNAKSGSLNI
jgi:Sterol desaturase